MSAETNKRTTSNNNSILWIILAFAGLMAGGFIIAQTTPLLFPPQGSAESYQVDELFKFMMVIGGAIFLLVQGMIVYSVLRFRTRAGDMSDGPPMHGNATLELVWTAIPGIIVLVLAIYSYSVWVDIWTAKDNEQSVLGIGQRFAWSFSYEVPRSAVPDDVDISTLSPNIQQALEEEGAFNMTSTELHTYVGQSVRVALNTDDSQHAFWVPAMRVKQDLLPGRTTETRFTPVLAGEYPIVCAELCGSGHGDMRARIIVHEDQEAYVEWFNNEAAKVFYPPEDPVLRGEQVLASGAYPCAGCHTLSEMGWQGVTGPNLNGIGERAATTRSTTTGQTPEEYLFRSLYFPTEYVVPGFGPLMPQFHAEDPGAPFYMPASDGEAITAYLCTQSSGSESVCDLEDLAEITAAHD